MAGYHHYFTTLAQIHSNHGMETQNLLETVQMDNNLYSSENALDGIAHTDYNNHKPISVHYNLSSKKDSDGKLLSVSGPLMTEWLEQASQ